MVFKEENKYILNRVKLEIWWRSTLNFLGEEENIRTTLSFIPNLNEERNIFKVYQAFKES